LLKTRLSAVTMALSCTKEGIILSGRDNGAGSSGIELEDCVVICI
jgi:hypothetical protein